VLIDLLTKKKEYN